MQFAQHAGFAKLYHYEPFKSQYLEGILRDRKIHVSNIGNVNDPWDCHPWFDKDVSDSSRRREWVSFFTPMLELRTVEQREAIARLNPPWMDNGPFLGRSIDGLIESVVENNIHLWRIYCLTPHVDSILMWSHYANHHTGICLEFDINRNIFGWARKVTYREDFLVINPALLRDPTALTETILLTKSSHWGYENEYRLLARDRKTDPQFSLTCEDEFLLLPTGSLTGVIVGAKCSETNVASIKALVAEYAPDVVLKRAACVPHKYEVAITP